MKKFFSMVVMTFAFALSSFAQADIQFETKEHDFGTFAEGDGVQTCVFKFTNVGDQPLVISNAIASCGCTVPTYTKQPIKPGEKGEITVKYNGTGKNPGMFSKTVSVSTNAKNKTVRLRIKGNMTL